jgi:hypothetical protein
MDMRGSTLGEEGMLPKTCPAMQQWPLILSQTWFERNIKLKNCFLIFKNLKIENLFGRFIF